MTASDNFCAIQASQHLLRQIVCLTVLLGAFSSVGLCKGVAGCNLTDRDRANNSKLSFEDFDQKETTPTTGRALYNRGCYAEASLALQDYLVNGDVASLRQRSILMFHLAQNLALSGDYETASIAILGARRSYQEGDSPSLDWNTYVLGTWAFLVGNVERLESAHDILAREGGESNIINAHALARLRACFLLPIRSHLADCIEKNSSAE